MFLLNFLFSLFAIVVSVVNGAVTIQCPINTTLEFQNFRFTPCLSIQNNYPQVMEQCRTTGSCTFTNAMIPNTDCETYLVNSAEHVYICRPNDFEDIIVINNSNPELTFTNAFEPCPVVTTIQEYVFSKSISGPRNPGEFVRPTYEQKRYWKAFGEHIKNQHWRNVKALGKRNGHVGMSVRRRCLGNRALHPRGEHIIVLLLPLEFRNMSYQSVY